MIMLLQRGLLIKRDTRVVGWMWSSRKNMLEKRGSNEKRRTNHLHMNFVISVGEMHMHVNISKA